MAGGEMTIQSDIDGLRTFLKIIGKQNRIQKFEGKTPLEAFRAAVANAKENA
jgi:hypothetical protein